MDRSHSAIGDVVERLLSLRASRPLRVAVDGRTASGKTTFADNLATLVRGAGRPVIRASPDGFHRPSIERHRQGRLSPDGYYEDARDFEAMRQLLLVPLGPAGDRRYISATFDLERDVPLERIVHRAAKDAILVVDGTFLQRPELKGSWDFVIFLDLSKDEAHRRGVARDEGALGGFAAVSELYEQRYSPAFDRYEAECQPAEHADVIVGRSPG